MQKKQEIENLEEKLKTWKTEGKRPSSEDGKKRTQILFKK